MEDFLDVLAVPSLVITGLALFVAALSLQRERVREQTGAIIYRLGRPLVPHPGPHGGTAAGAHDVWEVEIDLVGPASYLRAEMTFWGDQNEVVDSQIIGTVQRRVWCPGDDPLKARIKVAQAGIHTDLWFGMTWVESLPYSIGVVSHARRRRLSLRTGLDQTYRWSHWRRRWVRERRRTLLSPISMNWTDGMIRGPRTN